MAESKSLLDSIHVENGYQIIDLEEDCDKYDLLSLIFHKETFKVDKDQNLKVVKNDSKRYFADNTVCYKCGDNGHVSRECPTDQERNCFYCDTYHKGAPCAFMFCDNCWNCGHSEKFCREGKRKQTVCSLCPYQNHLSKECPKLWRRYILKNVDSNQLKMSCAYCCANDHLMDDCDLKERKFSVFTKNYKNILKKMVSLKGYSESNKKRK